MRLLVKCPNCSHQQETKSIKNARCYSCGCLYAINPKNKFSRIVKIVEGTKEELIEKYRTG